jgi:hypothetical protein
MARQELSKRFNRKLIELGKETLCITLPKEYIQELEWTKGKELKVRLNKSKGRLIIEEIVD